MSIRAFRMQFAIVLSLAMAACGGGGGGGPQQPPPPPPQGQTISFAQAGPLVLILGATLTNTASGGGGTGAITYQSSDTSVLTVNATSGVATSVALGSATVTATKAADAGFTQAQATYTINVQTTAPLGAWIRETDTLVNVPDLAVGKEFFSVLADNCATPADVSSCPFAVPANVNSVFFTEINSTLTSPAYYALRSGSSIGNATLVSTQRFSERIGHAALFFNNRYWVIGGGEPQIPTNAATPQYTILSDVWSSPDGKTWKLETDAAAFGPHWFHQAVVHDGAMWVMSGGSTPTNFVTDVWSSTDGVTWTQRTTNIGLPWNSIHLNVVEFDGAMWAISGGTSFSSTDGVTWTQRSAVGAIAGNDGRAYASLTVYDGSLWYIAGAPGLSALPANAVNDVWKSDDGIDWVQVTPNAQFARRMRHQAFVVNGRLWVLGGQLPDVGGTTQWALDAWSTTDGATWTAESTGGLDATYLGRVVEQTGPERVTLIGGVQRGYSNNVWRTTNGTDWTALSADGQFSPRATRGVSFAGRMWLIGGATTDSAGSGARSNEVWRSSSGADTEWERVATSGTIFSPRDGNTLVAFQNKLWVIGGWDGEIQAGGTNTRFNDVWSSDDGVTWTKHEPTGGVIFSPRVGHDAVVFQDKLWVIAGNVQNDTDSNEVWSSPDGDTWTPVTQVNPFSARRSHRVVEFNGEMWMIGGAVEVAVGADEGTDDVWHSADGASWTTVSAGYPPRARHGLEVFNGRMYMIGGLSNEDYFKGTRYNDVWSSADGVQWQQETPVTPFPPRWLPALIHHGPELWLIGGYDRSFRNDVWRSIDGTSWQRSFSHEIVVP
ncbi:MAG TPA: hypothetical protein VJ299_07655 [Steroidobacteraceae bacterium]|nr:hypothetical protein [Steroidobacteraceae bacterium]